MVKKFQKIIRSISFKRVFALLCAVFVISLTVVPFFSFSVSAAEPLPNYGLWLDLTYLSDDATLTVHYSDGTMVFGGATHGNNIYIEPYDLDDDPVSGGIVLRPLFSERSGLYYYYIDFACDMNNSRVEVVDDGTVLNSYTASTSQIEIDYDKSYDIRFISGSNTINYSTGVMIYFLSSGYNAGYSAGYDAGYSNGQLAGYKQGYEIGKNDGYLEGYSVASSETFDMFITDPVSALFNFEIMPDITIGGLFATVVGLSLLLAFLKYFAGG